MLAGGQGRALSFGCPWLGCELHCPFPARAAGEGLTCRPSLGSVVGQQPGALVKQVLQRGWAPLGFVGGWGPSWELSQVSHQPFSLSPWPWQPSWTLGTPRPSPQPHQPASSAESALAGSCLAGEAAPSLPLTETPGQGWHCLAAWEGPQRKGPAGSPLFFLDSLLLAQSVLVSTLQPPPGALSAQDFPSSPLLLPPLLLSFPPLLLPSVFLPASLSVCASVSSPLSLYLASSASFAG